MEKDTDKFKKYKKPVFQKQKGFDFKCIINENFNNAKYCVQCSGCHGCR